MYFFPKIRGSDNDIDIFELCKKKTFDKLNKRRKNKDWGDLKSSKSHNPLWRNASKNLIKTIIRHR